MYCQKSNIGKRDKRVISLDLFGKTVSNLEKGLNYATLKGKTISQNIANVDTPNYKAKSVSFKEVFENAQTDVLEAYRTDARHLPFRNTKGIKGVYDFSTLQYRHNGNGVDMDKEQADLATNQIYYNALVDRMNGKFNTLQNVIKGGK